MSLRKFGIYLAYAPGLDLRHEGLGRYLAAFLKGTSGREDVRFVLVCPSWSKKGLEQLFQSEGVLKEQFEIVSPERMPLILRLYDIYQARKKRLRKLSIKERLFRKFLSLKIEFTDRIENRLVETISYSELFSLAGEVLAILLISLLLSPVAVLGIFYLALLKLRTFVKRLLRPFERYLSRWRSALGAPKNDATLLRLYRKLERVESGRMLRLIDGMKDVKAWYSPTAFWPEFNKIRAPRLICVPDVVLSDFPTGFSKVGDDRFLQNFERVEKSIREGLHFVSYSECVKWGTLVGRYAIPPSNVTVIHHAPNDLSRWVTLRGLSDVAATSHNYSKEQLRRAFRKTSNHSYASGFANTEVKFLFYASQFRPNKNVITLLKAYEYLLRRKFIAHKLVLTGHVAGFPVVKDFIRDHFLENDVVCIHGLSIQELAACYKLADLAVNPSLSEGGCPFTFTEALSVSTPVVMARIPVTEEVIVDADVQAVTLFDPYDWMDVARKIEWALENRSELLMRQEQLYADLSLRTWIDVVNEHIEVLDRISIGSEV